ncbi:hypothetical protein ACSJLP_14175 [Gordonia rhizosphera NBRC 16068]|uniref:Uncharacterized protein n=2 Tax=Gordonia rhizosphera TaxID=83341 RepID=K6W7C0_9ACTN|nr:hypothetical protein GORHZ_068_00320 [Gordonia rhizosphera NBRC 16068]
MSRQLLHDAEIGTEGRSEDLTALEVAEAEAAAAEAEAAAARARAQLARARARIARRGDIDRQPTSTTATVDDPPAEPTDTVQPADATEVSDTDIDTGQADTEVLDATGNEAEENTSDIDDPATPKDSHRSGTSRVVAAVRRRTPAPRLPNRRTAAISIMAVVTIAALVVTGLIGWHHRQVDTGRAHAAEFTKAAELGVTALTSLDFRDAQRDVQRIIDHSTGAFYDDFKGRAKDFTTVIEQSKVTTKGHVTAAALESMNDNSAVVLVAATSDVTNAAGAKQEPRVWRLRVSVTDVDGTMKISKVDFVP